MTIHIQMLQDIATHARAMADSMGNWRAGYIERCPSGSGRRETVSVHDSTVKLTPWSLKCPSVMDLWRKPVGLWRLHQNGQMICRCGQTDTNALTIKNHEFTIYRED